ncbi:MAG TPA: MFS transporter [Usitatibacter sp.]|nr:MFS transporter [Usitatibacter sp.]
MRAAFFVLFLCFAFNMLGRGVADSYIVFLLPLSVEFGWSRAQVASVYSVYLVVTGLAGPMTGMLFDRWGPRIVYPVGVLALGVGTLLAGRLSQLWQFYICIGILGGIAVSALGMIPASSLIRRWFRGNMTTAIAIAYAGMGSGALVMAPFTQYLIATIGWRATYHWMGIVLLALLPLVVFLPWRRLAAGHPDIMTRAGSSGAAAAAPRRWSTVLRSREYWSLVQVFFFTAFAMHGVIVQIVAYLVDAGFRPLEAATAFGTQGLLSVVGMISAGWLSDRLGYRATATTSFVLTFTGVGLLMLLAFVPTRLALYGFVLVFGLSQGARGPIVSSMAAKLFPGAGFATIFGTIFACMSIGSGLGSYTSGLLHDLTGGYVVSFVVSMTSICLAAMPFWTTALPDRR